MAETRLLSSRAQFVIGLLLVGAAVFGLDKNIGIGLAVFGLAFYLMANGFWTSKKYLHWKPIWRFAIVGFSFLVYFSLIGLQARNRYLEDRSTRLILDPIKNWPPLELQLGMLIADTKPLLSNPNLNGPQDILSLYLGKFIATTRNKTGYWCIYNVEQPR